MSIESEIRKLKLAQKCCKEDVICLNNAVPAFTPVDPFNPTTDEVQAWSTANLTSCQFSGTHLSYFIPAYNEDTDLQIAFDVDPLAEFIITSFIVNGDQLIVSPITVVNNVPTFVYTSELADLFNAWLLLNPDMEATFDDSDFVNGIIDITGILGNLSISFGLTYNGIGGGYVHQPIVMTPAVGSCEEPLFIWVLSSDNNITRIDYLAEQAQRLYNFDNLTTIDADNPDGTAAPVVPGSIEGSTYQLEYLNGFIEWKFNGTIWEFQSFTPYIYYGADTIFVTDEGSETPTPGYKERSYSFAQFDALIETAPSNLKVILLGENTQVLDQTAYTTLNFWGASIIEVIIPVESKLTDLIVQTDTFVGGAITLSITCHKNLDSIDGDLWLGDSSNTNFQFLDITTYGLITHLNGTVLVINTKINNITTLNSTGYKYTSSETETLVNCIINFTANNITNCYALVNINKDGVGQSVTINININNIDNSLAKFLVAHGRYMKVFCNINNIGVIGGQLCSVSTDVGSQAHININSIQSVFDSIFVFTEFHISEPDAGAEKFTCNINIKTIYLLRHELFIYNNPNRHVYVNINVGEIKQVTTTSYYITLQNYHVTESRFFFNVDLFRAHDLISVYNFPDNGAAVSRTTDATITISGNYLGDVSLISQLYNERVHCVLNNLFTHYISADSLDLRFRSVNVTIRAFGGGNVADIDGLTNYLTSTIDY